MESIAVVVLDWKAVGRDGYLKQIVRGEQVERVFSQLHIRAEEVWELAAFSDGREGLQAGTGMLLSGAIDARGVASRLKAEGWAERGSGGYRVYTNPGDGTCLAALKNNLLALGTPSGVEGVLKASADPSKSFASNPAYQKLSPHLKAGCAPILMVTALPEVTQDMATAVVELSSTLIDFAGAGSIGDLLRKIGYVRGFGCTIDRSGDGLPVELLALMNDEKSATLVSGTLNLLKELGAVAPSKNLLPSDKDALRRMQKLSITRKGEILLIHLTMPLDGFQSR